MSLRVSPTPLIAGAVVVGNTGLGVLGSDVPISGDAGASYLYNDLSLPADNNVEVRGLIVTPPSAGAFFAFEDGSFNSTGAPDGSYSFVYRLFADGVDLGTTTASLTLGASGGVAGSVALDGADPAGVMFGQIGLGGAIAADDAVAEGTLGGTLPLNAGEMRQLFGWVSDLARIHGLIRGEPLVVTPTQRSAGSVVQVISESNGTVTVKVQ